MPIGINSAARNLFLLGSSGSLIDNFFKLIDQSTTTNSYYQPSGIIYDDSDGKYLLSGIAEDQNAVPNKYFGWIEKRDYDSTANPTSTTDWDVKVESTQSGVDTVLRDITATDTTLYAVGKTGDIPWIAKYNSSGVEQWTSTTNTGDVEYTGVSIDSNGNAYACGNTNVSGESVSFVEKFDSSGNPGWGKAAFMLGRDVVLSKIAANTRGEVVAAGFIEDDTANKGFIVKIDTNTGNILWDRTLSFTDKADGNSKNININDIKIDDNDRIYIVGEVGLNSFVVKYTPEGNLLWQKQTGYSFDLIGVDISHVSLTVNSVTQDITVASNFASGGIVSTFLSNYNRKGDLIWRREISQGFGGVRDTSLDNEGAFIFFIFDPGGSTGDQYTFGKLSATGNGLGNFQYDDGTTAALINYNYTGTGTLADDVIGRLSDGSVRNDTSDFITYPFGANKIVFDDLATHVSNKRRQMDSADSFQYSGSPAIRVADFQELNLLGDTGITEEVIITPSTTESENFTSVTSSYSTYGTVAENTVTNDPPYTASHYDGKVRDLQSGGFRVDLTGNSTGSEFIMGCWVKFDTYTTARQMGIDLNIGYVYWETQPNGVIRIRHNGGASSDSSATNIDDGNWHHIALVRSLGTLRGYVDGQQVVSTTSGVGGLSVNTNEQFWFFGGNGTSYNTDAKILDPFVYVGYSFSGSYTVPTTPIIDADGNINHLVSALAGFEEYISPGISIAGEGIPAAWEDQSGNGNDGVVNGPTHNAAGYWEFDGVDDNMTISRDDFTTGSNIDFSIESWFYFDTLPTLPTSKGYIWDQSPGASGAAFRASTAGDLTTFAYPTVGGGVVLTNSAVTLQTGRWYHAVSVFETDKVSLYVDGVLANATTTATISSVADPGNTDFFIGCAADGGNGNGSEFMDGRIGEFRIYPRALTPAQVFQNYNATKSKYINEAPDTAPKIGPGIVYDSNLLLNYDFGNRATYDRVENLIEISEDFTGTGWGETFTSIVPNVAIAPDGTMTADKIVENNTNTFHFLANTEGIGAEPVVWSCFIKAAERTQASLLLTQGGNNGAIFNLDTGTIASVSGAGNTAQIQDVGNGWYRCIVKNDGASDMYNDVRVGPVNGSVTNYQGDGTSGIYVWGAQYERATEVSRYIRTYGSNITAPTTVKNLSNNLYTATMGVIGNAPDFNSTGYFSFDATNDEVIALDGTVTDPFPKPTNPSIEVWGWKSNWDDGAEGRIASCTQGGGYQIGVGETLMGSANVGSIMSVGGSYSVTQYARSNLSSGWHHFVGTFDGATLRFYVDGTEVDTDSSRSGNVTYGTPTDFLIGGEPGSPGSPDTTIDLTGRVGQVRVYDRALSATEVLQNFNATKSKYGL